MFRKFALLCAGMMLTVSSVGCCLCGGYGWGANRCSPCTNGCSPTGGGYIPQGYVPQTGQLYQGDMSQTALAPVGYTQSAFVPAQTATAIPGAIQGPPIYQQAVNVPMNSLPTF